MLFYADEDFELPITIELRHLGHDVVTVQEDGCQGADDLFILQRAHSLGRVLLTNNRRHFERLHRDGHAHSGIVSCKHAADSMAMAMRIDLAVSQLHPGGWCLRVNRGP